MCKITASYSTVRLGLNLPVWNCRTMACLYPTRTLRRGCERRVCPCEQGSVQVCSVTRYLQYCARGNESASVELEGLRVVSYEGLHTYVCPCESGS